MTREQTPTVRFTVLDAGGREPVRQMPGDAGYDLYASELVVVPSGAFADVPHSIALELPPRCWALITGRSSSLRKRGLHVAQGVIDNGYRGPIFTGVWNLTANTVRIAPGERVSQLILMPLLALPFEQADDLSEAERGLASFGSTGL